MQGQSWSFTVHSVLGCYHKSCASRPTAVFNTVKHWKILQWISYTYIIARCSAEEERSSFYGSYFWPENIEPEVTIQRRCFYSCGSFTGGSATRYCTGRGLWNSTNFSECPTKRTCDLIAFANVSEPSYSSILKRQCEVPQVRFISVLWWLSHMALSCYTVDLWCHYGDDHRVLWADTNDMK